MKINTLISYCTPLLLFTGVVHSIEYKAGVGLDYTFASNACSEFATRCDDSSLGYGIYARGALTPWVSTGLSFNHYGQFSAVYETGERIERDIYGADVSLLMHLPNNSSFEPYAQLGGGYFFDQKSSQSWSGLIGAGISTSLNRHWDIDVGYKYVPNVAGLDGDIHSFGMGLAYNFGSTETTLFTSRVQTETGNAEKNTLKKAAVVPVVKTTEVDVSNSKESAASKVGTRESLVTVPDKGLNEPRKDHQKLQKSDSSHLIEFRKGSAWLTQSVNQQLSSLVEQIREEDRSPISIEIIGSASKDGSREFNYYLSEMRATRVAEYIKNTNLSDLKTNVRWVGDCSKAKEECISTGHNSKVVIHYENIQ